MTLEQGEVLRRFHAALVREIQGKNPDHLRAPFTVAEIYQNLVPYRTHRDEIGVEMSADYEHALLRLLAGEGDFLTIESRTARQEIREELESPNPNTGLYRDFAAADVRLNPDKVAEALAWMPGEVVAVGADVWVGSRREEEASLAMASAPLLAEDLPSRELDSGGSPPELSGQDVPLSREGGEEEREEVVEEALVKEEPAGDPKSRTVELGPAAPENCPWCRENLPKRPGVRFCPFCGSNVRSIPCPVCGEELELYWRFCIACGTEVAS